MDAVNPFTPGTPEESADAMAKTLATTLEKTAELLMEERQQMLNHYMGAARWLSQPQHLEDRIASLENALLKLAGTISDLMVIVAALHKRGEVNEPVVTSAKADS